MGNCIGELNFMFGQGIKLKGSGLASGYDAVLKYSSLDIPLLVRYAFINKPVVFGLQAGPYISIPFGLKASGNGAEYMGIDGDFDSGGALGGITVGAFVGYPLGPGKIIGDVRFLTDFGTLKAHESGFDFTVSHRAGINLTFGYEISFNKK
ncbi:hypothetical protein AGMMS49587_01280 [Spirochaetia bacterium]|nr:hypothetical protein AGMMS49587_01280 [Spirochaetia bacterium]